MDWFRKKRYKALLHMRIKNRDNFYINVPYKIPNGLNACLYIEPVQKNFMYRYFQRKASGKCYPRNYYICG